MEGVSFMARRGRKERVGEREYSRSKRERERERRGEEKKIEDEERR